MLCESDLVQSFSCLYFLALRLNTKIYSVNIHIQSTSAKMRTRVTPNTATFYVVMHFNSTLIIYFKNAFATEEK